MEGRRENHATIHRQTSQNRVETKPFEQTSGKTGRKSSNPRKRKSLTCLGALILAEKAAMLHPAETTMNN
jgi:hypothetical protein